MNNTVRAAHVSSSDVVWSQTGTWGRGEGSGMGLSLAIFIREIVLGNYAVSVE